MSNYIDYSDDYTPSDTEKLADLQRRHNGLKRRHTASVILNYVLTVGLAVWFIINYTINIEAGIVKRSSVVQPTTTQTVAPTKAPVQPTTTALKRTVTTAPQPTASPTRVTEIFNKLEYETTELSTGERATIVLNVRHNGCFKSDLNDCDGQVVSLMSADKKAYYVNDFEKRLSYLVHKDWATIKWNTNLHIFTNNVFRIATPTP